MNANKIGFKPTDILIPQNTDMKKWSVVACDQYTSQPEYWERVRKFVGNEPSSLNLILPEVDLNNADPAEINRNMAEYLDKNVFKTLTDSFIFVRRFLDSNQERLGLIGALDLECYDYHKGSVSLCRATEGTVEERLPPRIRIRKDAKIELPHIMVLIDDPEFTVIEALNDIRHEFKKIYDFTLMEKGGNVTGYAISKGQAEPILKKIAALAGEEAHPLLYAVGDGNHSLATAKACYEKIKQELGEAAKDHPARYCLVELVNVHSSGLNFEPIHRVVFDTEPEKLMAFLQKKGLTEGNDYEQKIVTVQNGAKTLWSFKKESAKMAVGSLQNALDEYLSENDGTIDYIHGEDVVEQLCAKKNAIGFILPEVYKSDLFPTVVADGALPRKTFSMGHAHDKRFYLEARRIKNQ